MKTLGILAALHEEIAVLLQDMDDGAVIHHIGQRDYYEGVLYGQRCIVVLARIGKVAAAATTVTLIREFNVDEIIFAGVAGAVAEHVRVGDVVIAGQLLQHDMDASPIFPKYEVPLLGVNRFEADSGLCQRLMLCATEYLQHGFHQDVTATVQAEFGLGSPSVYRGTIISGDQFVNDNQGVQALAQDLPDALCVEMEGAAVAQICYEYGVPFAVFRTISDAANDTASMDFAMFLERVARFYSAGILRYFLAGKPDHAIGQSAAEAAFAASGAV